MIKSQTTIPFMDKTIIEEFSQLPSTQDYLKSLAPDIPKNCFYGVRAETQTKGRGQFQRPWHNAKENLLCSFATFFPKLPPHLPYLGIVIACQVCQSLLNFGYHLDIQWPNDITFNGIKLGGILCETQEIHKQHFICIGIGLNLCQSPHLNDRKTLALSDIPLSPFYPLQASSLFKGLTQQIKISLKRFFFEGFPPFYPAFQKHFSSSQKPYLFQSKTVCLKGLNEKGAFLYRDSNNQAIESFIPPKNILNA